MVENRFRFNGQQYDPITQQYYLRARFYNPVIGRFTQEDTYRGDGLNLYAYCVNNPVYYVDPSGNFRQCVKEAFDAIRKANPNMSASVAYDLALKQTGKSKMVPTGLKRWKHFIYFRKNKVYQRNDLFDPNQMTTWTRRKKIIVGTNKQRMAAGNVPIGYDGNPVELHHLLQSQNGPIIEISATSHDAYYSIIHMNTRQSKSTINRNKFNTWKRNYWKDRARDFK